MWAAAHAKSSIDAYIQPQNNNQDIELKIQRIIAELRDAYNLQVKTARRSLEFPEQIAVTQNFSVLDTSQVTNEAFALVILAMLPKCH